MKFVVAIIVLMLIALPVMAAGVDGNWNGTVPSQKGDQSVGFSFKANGNDLSGMLLNSDGSSVRIENGHIDGSNLTFSVSLSFPGKSFTRTYKGVLDADQIKFSATVEGQVSEFVVKRVK